MNWTRPVLNSYQIGQVSELIQIFSFNVYARFGQIDTPHLKPPWDSRGAIWLRAKGKTFSHGF